MLLDDHIIIKEDLTWRVEESRLTQLRVPPSLMGLLQARLDTLLYPEKLILQRAAVFGRVFVDGLLMALDAADETHLSNLPARLQTLEQRGFIQQLESSSFANNREYAFTQGMVRDLLYDTLLERQYQGYHAATATWLAQSERVAEYLPVIAEHYEKAKDTAQAVIYWERAGDKAMRVSSFSEAIQFFNRALTLISQAAAKGKKEQSPFLNLPEPDNDNTSPSADRKMTESEGGLYLKLAEVYFNLSDYPATRAALNEALRLATTPAAHAAALALLGNLISEMQGDYVGANALLLEALPLARAGADPTSLAQVLVALGGVNWRLGELSLARNYYEEGLVLARAQGEVIRELYALNGLAVIYALQNNWPTATRLFQEVLALAITVGNRERASAALTNLGELSKYQGDWAEARNLHQQALILAQEIGGREAIVAGYLNLVGDCIVLQDLPAARAHLRAGLALTRELGTLPWVLAVVHNFADLLVAQGQTKRALSLVGLAQHHPAFDSSNQYETEAMLARWNLDVAVVEAGLARGAALDFEAMVAEIAAELEQN